MVIIRFGGQRMLVSDHPLEEDYSTLPALRNCHVVAGG